VTWVHCITCPHVAACAEADGCERLRNSKVIAYCWEVNESHPRLIGKHYTAGGERVALGQRGPWFASYDPPQYNPWGLTQVWKLQNGQEVRVTWK